MEPFPLSNLIFLHGGLLEKATDQERNGCPVVSKISLECREPNVRYPDLTLASLGRSHEI